MKYLHFVLLAVLCLISVLFSRNALIQSIQSFRKRFDSDVFVSTDVNPDEFDVEKGDSEHGKTVMHMRIPEKVLITEPSIVTTQSLQVHVVATIPTENSSESTLVLTTSKPGETTLKPVETTSNPMETMSKPVKASKSEVETISSSVPSPNIEVSYTPNNQTVVPSILPFDQHYLLVLFTTVEIFGKKSLSQSLKNTLRMFELFQRNFSFRALVYTNSKLVIQTCDSMGIYSEGDYDVNTFGMPFASYMYKRTQVLVKADYYGYINSDIIVSPNLFDILKKCGKLAKKGVISHKHEVSSIVWDIFRLGAVDASSVESYENHIINQVQLLKNQRDYRSADYFIFSSAVSYDAMDPVVVGRMRIDNYLLSYIFKMKGSLVDVTNRVVGIHQGLDGYKEHTKGRKKKKDIDWNFQWTESIKKIKGALMYADYRFNGDPYTWKIMARSRERVNIRLRKDLPLVERKRIKIIS